MNDNGKIGFSVELDSTQLRRDVQKAKNEFRDLSDSVESECGRIDGAFSKVGKAVGSLAAAWSFQEFARQVATVRGEFQKLEVAMETMLGSKSKADALMNQMVKTAATTPFSLQDVAGGAKQLLAYGMAADKVNDTLVRLGNIASGLSIPLNDMIYLFGTTMSQGRLYQQDLNQFTGRGIPMLKELSKQFGVTEAKVKELVTAGKIGFPEVEKAINSLTNEGGMFFNLMEKQSHTITGQISNIGDAFDSMLNEIGQSNEGIINGALEITSTLLENYKEIGKAIAEIIAAYGVYKAAVIALSAIENIRYQATLMQMAGMTRMQVVTDILAKKTAVLHTIMAKNPYALTAIAVTALAAAMYKLVTYQTDYQKQLAKLDESVSEFNVQSNSEQRNLAMLKAELSGLKKGTKEYDEVKQKIVKGYSQYYDGLEAEIEKVGLTEKAYDKLTEAITRSFGARQYDKFKKEQEASLDDVMSENLEAIQKKLQEQGQVGQRAYVQIRNALFKGEVTEGKNKYGQGILEGLSAWTEDAINKSKGKGFFKDGTVEQAIRRIIKAQEENRQLDDMARQRFGIKDETTADSEKGEAKKEPTTYLEDVEAAKKDWLKAKKAYEEIIKDQKATSKQVIDARTEMAEKAKAYQELSGSTSSKAVAKQKNEQKSQTNELLELMKSSEERQISMMKEGTAKRVAEINLRYDRELEEVRKMEEELRKAQGGNLSAEQQSQLSSATDSINAKRNAEISVTIQNEKAANQKAMNDYLKQYGSYMEKKEAISREYNQKIAEAATEGERMSLQKQMEEELSNLDLSAFKEKINFSEVFGNLDEQTTSALKHMQRQLRDFIEVSDEMTPENIKELSDALKEIDALIASRSSFKLLGDSMNDYFESNRKVKKAQDDLNAVMNGGEVITGIYTDATGKLVKKTLSQADAEKALSDAQSDRQKTLANLTKAANSIGQQGSQLVNAGNQVVGMLENFGVKVPEAVGATLDGIGQTMSALESIDLTKPFSAVTGILGTVTGIGNTIAGLFGFGGGADYSGYNKLVEKYDALIDIWDDLIDKKSEYISIDYGTEAQKAADEAMRLVEVNIQRQRNLLQKLSASGTSGFSHSLGHRIDARMSMSDWERISDLVGEKISSQSQLWELSSEQMEKLLTDDKLVSVLDTVNSDFIEYIKNIAQYGEQLEDIAKKEKEAVTGMGFESFRDGYVDMLSDLDATNEDFADQFEQYMQNAIFRSLVANEYSDRIQALYDSWADLGKDGLSSTEADGLRAEQDKLTEEILARREQLMKEFGWKHSSEEKETSSEIAGLSELQKAYDRLGDAVSRAYSSDKVKAIEQQNANLMQQKRLVEERIAIEKDEDTLEGYRDQLEDINAQLEANKEAARDAIFGSDVQSAINDFVSAYTNALGNGDTSGVAEQFVQSLVKQMVVEAMKADASPIVDVIRTKLIEAWKDGVISSDEQAAVQDLINQLNKEFEDKYGWADDLFQNKEEVPEKQSSEIEGVKELQNAYNDLSGEVSKVYSTERVKVIQEQISLLEKQKKLLESSIASSSNKELTDGWEEQLKDVNKSIEDAKEAQIDAIFGTDIQSAISSFANALIDAWARGEDRAKTSQQIVSSIIRSLVVEMMKMSLAPMIEKLRDEIQEMLKDGIISPDEHSTINGMVDSMSGLMENQFAWADEFIKGEQTMMDNVQTHVEEVHTEAEEIKETFSGITFEGMRDDFISQLSDMNTSYEDMCNNMEDKLKQSIIKGFLESKYKDQIQNLISTWDMYGESGGNINEAEAKKLQEQYQQLLQAMIDDRDDLADKFGWSQSKDPYRQEASSKGFNAMDQETGDELNGRFTAVQEEVTVIRVNTEEMRNLQLLAVDHLEEISRNTHELYEINSRLGKIEQNTRNL